MIRAIIWKEWHEHRAMYLTYWLVLHAPLLVLALAIGLTSGARLPFADLSDALTMKYLPLSLIQTLLASTLFLILTGYLAVSTFRPEIDNHSLFFIYERPISRKSYLFIKLLNGACHVVLATCCAIVLLPVVSYVLMLMSGKITSAGSGAAFSLVMAAAVRGAVWCSLISLGAFTASALISALVPRWWLAALCSVAVTILLIVEGGDFFNFFPDLPDNSMSVGMNLSTGNVPWITISRAMQPAELKTFGNWHPWPLLTAVALVAVFAAATAFFYDRKELK